MASDEELPPVVAPFLADISALVRGIEEAKAALKSFTGTEATAVLNVDAAPALAEAALASGADGGAGGGGGGSVLGAAAGAAAGGGKGGGGGFLSGLLAAAGFGGGGGGIRAGRWGLGLLAGLPAMGTLGGLAGFSAEGVLGSLLGISGSIAGAGIGAGFLGLGALGTGAVGMGTDLAGIGQAASDVKKYRTALNSLNTAIATYGKNSTQAAAAQQHLNFVLSGMPAVARQAIVSLSNAISGFVTLFDKATGPAEKLGAQILTQAVHVGETFLPTIGMFAMQNMGIIRRSLQPFFSWLRTVGGHGGLGIFTHLEEVFQQGLPTGMHALEQGFELLAKTITIASGFMGKFLQHINSFLTRMNGATFGKWSHFVTDMIGLFNAWWPLVKAVGRTLFDLFKPAVGLGKNLAIFLTTLLGTFDKFLSLKSTRSILHQLFTSHMRLLLTGLGQILKNLLPIFEQFLLAWVQIETAFRVGFGVIADVLAGLTKIPFGTAVLGWVAALLLLSKGLAPVIGLLLGTNPVILGVIAGVIALGLAVDYLSHHWHQVWGDIKNWAADAWHFLENDVFHPLASYFTSIFVGGLHQFSAVWTTVWDGIKSAVLSVWHVIEPIFNDITHAIGDITGGIGKVAGGIGHGIGDVLHFVGLAEGGIVHRPTLAVVGEAGPEVVIPFSRLGGASITGGGISPLPSMAGVGAVGGQHVTVNILGSVDNPNQFAHDIYWHVSKASPPGVR